MEKMQEYFVIDALECKIKILDDLYEKIELERKKGKEANKEKLKKLEAKKEFEQEEVDFLVKNRKSEIYVMIGENGKLEVTREEQEDEDWD